MTTDISLAKRQTLISVGMAALALRFTKASAQQSSYGSGSSLNADQVRAQILGLEEAADARNLPASSMGIHRASAPIRAEELYLTTVPRLVALIDRDNAAPSTIGEKASLLLSQINVLQHEVPEAYTAATRGPAPAFASLVGGYRVAFDDFTVRTEYKGAVSWYIRAISRFRPRYEKVEVLTGVPWYVVGVVHALEGSFNFRGHLHNGDYPLSSRTHNVPANRPKVWLPPSDWESSAKDALDQMGFSGKTDWTVERTLYRLESYNGFGYRKRRILSPYLWSFSDKYSSGKFYEDRKFDKSKKSQQCGAAVMLRGLIRAGDIQLEHGLA